MHQERVWGDLLWERRKNYEQNVAALQAGATESATGSAESSQTMLSHLRATIPAAEAYYSDYGSYSGMTVAKLRQIDPGTSSDIAVGTATATSFCLQAESGGVIISWRRPSNSVTTGAC